MVAALGKRLHHWSERWVPDPFVFAIVLTIVSFVAAVFFGREVADLSFGPRLTALGDGWF